VGKTLFLSLLLFASAVLAYLVLLPTPSVTFGSEKYVSYRANLSDTELKLYWKDEQGRPLKSLGRLAEWLSGKGQPLEFAMNGGMYKAGNTPVGLFIEEQRVVTPLDTAAGSGNFYLKPNGVFYTTTDNQAAICNSTAFRSAKNVRFATQSGPLLVLNRRIHPAFRKDSRNLNIRNGVGILPNGEVLLAMSKEEVSFYDFALYFQQQGCRHALYLDGFVSRTYLPEKQWVQTDGDFGVIIGVTNR
jgi:uncharacterized protein YigE (DUF2233 family)